MPELVLNSNLQYLSMKRSLGNIKVYNIEDISSSQYIRKIGRN